MFLYFRINLLMILKQLTFITAVTSNSIYPSEILFPEFFRNRNMIT
jgi:hypothetical protein